MWKTHWNKYSCYVVKLEGRDKRGEKTHFRAWVSDDESFVIFIFPMYRNIPITTENKITEKYTIYCN